jgi:hypothetical protein
MAFGCRCREGVVAIKKILLVGTLTALAVTLMIDPLMRHVQKYRISWWVLLWWALKIIIVFAIIFILRKCIQRHYATEFKSPPSRSIGDIPVVPEAEAYDLQRLAGGMRLNAKQARIFSLAVLEPAELRQRISEHYIPDLRTLTQDVTMEIKIPDRLSSIGRSGTSESDDATGSTLLPIMILPKGEINDLDVFADDGDRIPVLSYREYLQLAAGILRLFLREAFGLDPAQSLAEAPHLSTRSAEFDVLHLEHRALCQIMKRVQANVKTNHRISPVSSEAAEIANLIENLQVSPERKVYLQLAGALIRKLSMHYALVAVVPARNYGRFVIRFYRTLIPELELAPDENESEKALKKIFERFKGWLRILLGTRPVSVTVVLDNAWTCQSYHVIVEGPEGLYLARQRFLASSEYLSEKAKNAPTPAHYRFRRRLGQRYAHFYGRFFPTPEDGQQRPRIQLDFLEAPPGSGFRAAIASCACLALVWVVGLVMSHTIRPGSDAPAFLLVFPGIAASWLGLDAPSRLFEGTLTARLSLGLTIFISVAASGLFICDSSGLSFFRYHTPTGISILGISDWSWAVLTIAAALNSEYMIYRWVRNSWVFKRLAERPDPDTPEDA